MNTDPDPTDQPDQQLLRRFADTRDERAFRVLVENYTSLVYGVALRRTGNPQAAEEVLQNVFLALAKKAGTLRGQRSLGAWLHRAATFESLKSLRRDATQQRHLAMLRDQQINAPASGDEHIWREVRPQLDGLLDRLSRAEREVLIAHYFEGLPFAEIAGRIGTTAAAAQKRSVRALGKLASMLAKRGAPISVGVLAAGLVVELAPAAPAGLATAIASGALSSSSSAAVASASASATLATAMSTSKIALAASFIVAASIPVGLRLSAKAAAAVAPEEAIQTTTSRRPAEPRDPSFTPEGFREALERLLESQPAAAAHTRRLQRLIFSLDLDQVRAAVTVLDEFDEPAALYDIIGTAFSRWSELDPGAAIADAVSRPPSRWGYYPLHGAWETWAFSDWGAARSWVSGTETGYDHSFLLWGYLDSMAGIDGALTVERARELGADFPERAEQLLGRALSGWTKSEAERAIAWVDDEIGDPVERDELLGRALESLGEPAPQTALSHVGLIENPERRREVRYNIFWGWSLQHPFEAAEYFERSQAGDLWEASTIRSAGESFARNLPERAMEIARSIEDPNKRDSYYVGVLSGATQIGPVDPSVLVGAADAISDEGARTNDSLTSFLRNWASYDRAAAEAWVEALPEGGKKGFAQHMFPRSSETDQH